MPTKSGIDAQIGYAAESTYGTGVTVTRFLPLVSESFTKEIEWIEDDGIIAGAQLLRSSQQAQGNATVGGDAGHTFYTQDSTLLLRAVLGTVSTTGTAAPYTHTFWQATPDVSVTAQVGRPTVYGSVIPFTYTGGKATSWEIAVEAGQKVTFGASWVFQDESLGTALASVSYNSSLRYWTARDVSLKIDGTAVPVNGFKASGENGLNVDRRKLGGTVIAEPLRGELAAITGEFSTDWGDPASMGTLNYHRFIGGTESALVVTMVSGTLEGTITANVRYDGATPNVEGPAVLQHTIPWKCAGPSTDLSAFSIVIKNNNATA